MKYLKIAIALGLVMLAAACGSHAPTSTTPPAAHASTPATTPAPDLNAELLAVSDLPAGWSVVGNTESGATPTCFITARSDLNLKASTKAQVTFVYGSNSIPVLGELLAYLPGRAQSSLTAASQSISRCGQISLTSGGVTLTGTVSPLSVPAVADQSSAYQVSLSGTASGTSITLDIDVVVFRKGDTVAIIQYADLRTPDITAVQQIVQHAAAKVA